MRKSVAATAFALATATSAYAADMPTKAPYYAPPVWSWTGLYAGAHAGYGWGSFSIPGVSGSSDMDGFLGGGQIGYNWQTGNLVFGVETDLSWGDISNKTSVSAGGVSFSETDKADWFGSVRGRIGYALNRNLLYFTGGWAWARGKVDVNVAVPSLGIGGAASSSATHSGWVLGGGWETVLTPNWTLAVEYQHVSFDTQNYFNTVPVDLDIDTVRLKVNYLFR